MFLVFIMFNKKSMSIFLSSIQQLLKFYFRNYLFFSCTYFRIPENALLYFLRFLQRPTNIQLNFLLVKDIFSVFHLFKFLVFRVRAVYSFIGTVPWNFAISKFWYLLQFDENWGRAVTWIATKCFGMKIWVFDLNKHNSSDHGKV